MMECLKVIIFYIQLSTIGKAFLATDLQQHEESHRETNDPDPWHLLANNGP